jgi:hypothetical protein
MGPSRLGVFGRRVPGDGTKTVTPGDPVGIAEGKKPVSGMVKYLALLFAHLQ